MAHLSRYLTVYPSRQKPGHFLLYSTLRGSTVCVSGAVLDAARDGSLEGPEAETLKQVGVLVNDLPAEREQIMSLLSRANSTHRCLKATVILNLDCNLDCGYCYEGKFRNEQYMSEATAQLLVETIVRDHVSKGKDVSLTFYGGEPLLSEDLILLISRQLQEAARGHSVKYAFNMVTNGTLLNRQTAERLIPLGLTGAKLTLDGPREIHDRQRPFASGSGSFDTIVENIASVCDLIQIQLGGNCYQENYREFPRMLDHLVGCGITPQKIFRVQFAPVTPQAGCADNNSGCANPTASWLLEAVPFLREEILRRGFSTTKPQVTACMIEMDNTLVVKHDGTLYKCPAFMGYDGLSVGTLADGISDYTESHCLGNWQNDECLDCAYLPLCFAGCRFANLLQGKELGALDCRRELYDATLETLILQNMAYPPQTTPGGKPK